MLFSGYIGPLTSVRVHGVSTLVDIILPTEPLLAVSDLQSLLDRTYAVVAKTVIGRLG